MLPADAPLGVSAHVRHILGHRARSCIDAESADLDLYPFCFLVSLVVCFFDPLGFLATLKSSISDKCLCSRSDSIGGVNVGQFGHR